MEKKFIPLSVPNICGNELKYVTEALQDGWVSTSGSDIARFEKDMASYLGIEGACAVQSGTAGLHLCLRHFGIGPGDLVLVPTLTFIASVNPIIYQGAEPVFCDCDKHLCIDAESLENWLVSDCEFDGCRTVEKKSGKTVKAIMVVHIFGDTADMDKLMDVAERYGLIVIEDATESLGSRFPAGRYAGRFTGTVGHAGVFSFNGNKIITTGGGGMVICRENGALDHIRYLSQQAKDDAVYFVNNEVGYNYRMTNLQACMGRAQLEQLDSFIQTKRANYRLYAERLADIGYGIQPFRDEGLSNCWFYSLLTGTLDSSVRDELIRFLNQNGIQTRPIWKLNHMQKPFAGARTLPCPNSEAFYAQVVNLPCSSDLSAADVEYVCQAIRAFRERTCHE